jgi:hypothetical protein
MVNVGRVSTFEAIRVSAPLPEREPPHYGHLGFRRGELMGPKNSILFGALVCLVLAGAVRPAAAALITYEMSGVVKFGTFSSGTLALPAGVLTNGTTPVQGILSYAPDQGVTSLPGDPDAPPGYLYFPTPSSVSFQLEIAGLIWSANGADDKNSGIILPVPGVVDPVLSFSSGVPTTFPGAPADHNVLQINVNPMGSSFELQSYDLAPGSGNILGSYVIVGTLDKFDLKSSAVPEPSTWLILVFGIFAIGMIGSATRGRCGRMGKKSAG